MGTLADMPDDTQARDEELAAVARYHDAKTWHNAVLTALTEAQQRHVDIARAHGATWAQVGQALGGMKASTARMRHGQGP